MAQTTLESYCLAIVFVLTISTVGKCTYTRRPPHVVPTPPPRRTTPLLELSTTSVQVSGPPVTSPRADVVMAVERTPPLNPIAATATHSTNKAARRNLHNEDSDEEDDGFQHVPSRHNIVRLFEARADEYSRRGRSGHSARECRCEWSRCRVWIHVGHFLP